MYRFWTKVVRVCARVVRVRAGVVRVCTKVVRISLFFLRRVRMVGFSPQNTVFHVVLHLETRREHRATSWNHRRQGRGPKSRETSGKHDEHRLNSSRNASCPFLPRPVLALPDHFLLSIHIYPHCTTSTRSIPASATA